MSLVISIVSFLWKAGWIKTIGAALVAWLFPSPLQKMVSKQSDIKKAEDKADEPGNDVTDLDKLP